MATLMERLAFLQKVPTLMKATADDETPCPGYLFEEIGKISHESVGCCQCLLEYLLDRLQGQSCHVKLKVLKILLHLCSHGSPHFVTELRRNATFIQEVTVYSGPPDPIHGSALYQKVRATAQDLASQLFSDTVAPLPALSPCEAATPTMGMGSESVPRSGMQGFGYSPRRHASGGGTFLDKIQKAAEVVASAVLPPTEHQGIRLHDNHYRAVVAPSAAVEVAVPACTYNLPSHGLKAARRCPGQAGGGWEESDSGHSSHDSSQENGDVSRASVGGSSKSGTGSHSGASRESGDLAERVEAMHLGDCCQETMLISSLTEGSKVFLSREETQHFIKECATLNCEVVVELLCRRLQDPAHTVQMRVLCAVACLMSSDLLSLDHIFSITQKHLVQLSEGPAGPVANKATKLLRQFEALTAGQLGVARRTVTVAPATASPLLPDDSSKLPGGASLPAPSRGRTGPQDEPLSSTGQQCWRSEGRSERVEPEDQRAPSNSRDSEPEGQTDSAPAAPTDRLSIFSGMELVTRGKTVCTLPAQTDCEPGALAPGPAVQDPSGDPHRAIHPPHPPHPNTSSTPPSHTPPHSRQQLSAFSFLNV
ncbi:AP-4 complex accessory subunit Tepsin [Megalops cyprinoides]|uniref:AP-4 complex accessory subunit Tepsin n=1 Tax=Megalops cyprinoides TaxID=118141 RepID=UPI0018655C22|nr:AP-4 complex accessory subunit Tepsin [Megalops cyprinoides]